MNPENRFRDLLSKLLDDDFSTDERDELSRLCDGEESFRDSLRDELELAELIRHATSDLDASTQKFSRALESRIEGTQPDFETLTQRLIDSESAPEDIDELVRHCWRDERNALQLRRDLKWADLFEQAAAPHRSEDAFVESLATRMWAEQEEDPFVAKTQSKIVSLFPDAVESPEPKRGMPRVISFGTWATAAAAAVIAISAIVATQWRSVAVAKIVHATPDIQWRNQPPSDNLAKGLYELDAGIVTLEFPDGAEMTIEGPAEFELRGEKKAFVHTGIAMLDQDKTGAEGEDASDSDANSGFTLQSRGIDFVDTHDTVGIDARSAASTEAIVFTGGAEVCLPMNSGSCRNLYEYEAVRVDLKREKMLDVPYNPKVFARSWEVLAGVEDNSGSVRIEMPGSKPEQAESGEEEEVQVFVENDRFVASGRIEVDTLAPGRFASASKGTGQALEEAGELRSYLLQLWPEGSEKDDDALEASVTFAHEVVGVIYSSERLEQSDAIVGNAGFASMDASVSAGRGLDASGEDGDAILLSDDRRTVNLKLQSGSDKDQLDHVRVLVALR